VKGGEEAEGGEWERGNKGEKAMARYEGVVE